MLYYLIYYSATFWFKVVLYCVLCSDFSLLGSTLHRMAKRSMPEGLENLKKCRVILDDGRELTVEKNGIKMFSSGEQQAFIISTTGEEVVSELSTSLQRNWKVLIDVAVHDLVNLKRDDWTKGKRAKVLSIDEDSRKIQVQIEMREHKKADAWKTTMIKAVLEMGEYEKIKIAEGQERISWNLTSAPATMECLQKLLSDSLNYIIFYCPLNMMRTVFISKEDTLRTWLRDKDNTHSNRPLTKFYIPFYFVGEILITEFKEFYVKFLELCTKKIRGKKFPGYAETIDILPQLNKEIFEMTDEILSLLGEMYRYYCIKSSTDGTNSTNIDMEECAACEKKVAACKLKAVSLAEEGCEWRAYFESYWEMADKRGEDADYEEIQAMLDTGKTPPICIDGSVTHAARSLTAKEIEIVVESFETMKQKDYEKFSAFMAEAKDQWHEAIGRLFLKNKFFDDLIVCLEKKWEKHDTPFSALRKIMDPGKSDSSVCLVLKVLREKNYHALGFASGHATLIYDRNLMESCNAWELPIPSLKLGKDVEKWTAFHSEMHRRNILNSQSYPGEGLFSEEDMIPRIPHPSVLGTLGKESNEQKGCELIDNALLQKMLATQAYEMRMNWVSLMKSTAGAYFDVWTGQFEVGDYITIMKDDLAGKAVTLPQADRICLFSLQAPQCFGGTIVKVGDRILEVRCDTYHCTGRPLQSFTVLEQGVALLQSHMCGIQQLSFQKTHLNGEKDESNQSMEGDTDSDDDGAADKAGL